MSTFTLAIPCLTTSNLPWFMDLTFQVPMRYCSLQHRTLLLSPVASTAGYCFCFGSIPSFFLESFLHWISPLASYVLIPDNHSWFDAFLLSHLFSCCSCGYPNPTYLWRPNTMKKLSKLGGKAYSQWERKRRGQGHPKDIGSLVNSKFRDPLPYQTTWPASWEICM